MSKIKKRVNILNEISRERLNQEMKWGEQNWPCLDPEILSRPNCTPKRMTEEYGIPSEEVIKSSTDQKLKDATVTYTDIALEEFCEAVSEFDPMKRREELIQLAAVVVGWIEKIDRGNY